MSSNYPPPISYYGGKQRLASRILPLIPPHARYVEPFIGGGAVFWGKEKSRAEAINDLDGRVVNFYQVVQNDFEALARRIRATLHSELEYQRAAWILKNPMLDPVEFAWAFWVQTNMSFTNKIFGGFAFNADAKASRASSLKAKRFEISLSERLAGVEIFCRDALDLIGRKDAPDTFFYLDPPYVSSDCGHYNGYTREAFASLLNRLESVQGKFLLSSYPEPELLHAVRRTGWHHQQITQPVAVSGKRVKGKEKTECLTRNYDLPYSA